MKTNPTSLNFIFIRANGVFHQTIVLIDRIIFMKNFDTAVKRGSLGHAANMDGVAAVERALAITQTLEAVRQPLTLAELAHHTELYKSTILRLLVSLERFGLVVRRSDQRYILGPFARRLGQAYDVCMPLEACLQPLMEQLVRDGMESPSFHVAHDGQSRICMLRVDSMHATLDRVRVGDLLPLHEGAPGKVLRQVAPDPQVTNISPLLQVSFGERDPSCGAVAGPVFGPGQMLLGALSFSGPLDRFTISAVHKMGPVLLTACKKSYQPAGGVLAKLMLPL